MTFAEGERGSQGESLGRAGFTCMYTKIQLTPGGRRVPGSVRDGRKGEIRVMPYLHCIIID